MQAHEPPTVTRPLRLDRSSSLLLGRGRSVVVVMLLGPVVGSTTGLGDDFLLDLWEAAMVVTAPVVAVAAMAAW